MTRILPIIFAILMLATPAEAGPIAGAFGVISSWIGGVIAAGGTGAFFLRVGVSVALSMLSTALGQKSMTPPGIKTSATTSGGTTPQKFILGLTAAGGQRTAPPMSFGNPGHTPRGNLIYVSALSVVPGCPLRRVIVDDEWFSGGTPDPDDCRGPEHGLGDGLYG